MKRNPIAYDLRTSKYGQRIVQPKKGKGSYDRQDSKKEIDDE